MASKEEIVKRYRIVFNGVYYQIQRIEKTFWGKWKWEYCPVGILIDSRNLEEMKKTKEYLINEEHENEIIMENKWTIVK